ncbi:MAG: diacylglycerol kinase family lipid kinase, partial [Clostridia bacterium]|nr:diacylglycerol kinase family lipid kinase [Deltaproteobacteria bacterium]
MKGLIVANPYAAAGAVGRNWDRLARHVHASYGSDLDLAFTTARGDATRIVHDAIAGGADRIIAVGGDGTINECVNGFAAYGPEVGTQLGVFPAGTGSDLARSIGIAKSTEGCSDRLTDIGRVSCVGRDGGQSLRWFLNVASMGASGLIVDKVNTTTKRFGGKASFMIGTLKGLARYKNQRIRLTIDDLFDGE